MVTTNSHFFHIAVNYKTSHTEQSYHLQIRQVSLYKCMLYKYCRVSKVSDKTGFTVYSVHNIRNDNIIEHGVRDLTAFTVQISALGW